eukprot:TRINITY_DN32636_c0_g2_i1.p1 TRINITY_DN32636_c0_g2~~TRINITY_DN32636_c0_g2_i1.p1  ORF type:complete len:872 (+),score=131.61 TRINITY_DN32636_c0_g2_i1:226-2841(+)
MSLFERAADLLLESFDYNRENFQNDRRQRQLMEYQLSNMRLDQAKMWREDVRDLLEFVPEKMEVYLVVIALELGFCVMALCKGRVPAGAPPWLIHCHTLAVCSAIMYLFLALWFGCHAFVSAQAYKVRILTQLVRLPVPTWESLEASRTYGSSFEKQGLKQMLRVPFLMGRQEQQINEAAEGVDKVNCADPWGLERCGDHFPELAPDANVNTEKQKHIWLVREAARFFQTYDAFCRISMSAGTTSLATFFCYFCLSYVLTEVAAPVAAWAGMAIFISCALVILRQDLMLNARQYRTLGFLIVLSPTLAAIVTFISSKSGGNPGHWEYLMPVGLFAHGLWLFYYIHLFRVSEVGSGAMLPMAFRSVLFLDAFACARHCRAWSLRLNNSLELTTRIWHPSGLRSGASSSRLGGSAENPAMVCSDSQVPRRPEDVETAGDANHTISFGPTTFTGAESDSLGGGITDREVLGEKPGLVPWRTFLFNTVLIAFMWWFAAGIAFVNAYQGTAVFVRESTAKESLVGVAGHDVLQGIRLGTDWYSRKLQGFSPRPRGLACDAMGIRFVTSGILPSGGRGLVFGELSEPSDSKLDHANNGHRRNGALNFVPAPPCDGVAHPRNGVGDRGHAMHDIALHRCDKDRCRALVLPRRGDRLVSCPLKLQEGEGLDEFAGNISLPAIARHWLDDRGGLPELGANTESRVEQEGLLVPEDLSAIDTLPCGGEACAVLGTTARRVVQMTSVESDSVGKSDSVPGQRHAVIAPWRLLREDHTDTLGPGSLASFNNGTFLAVLQREAGFLRILDVSKGGVETAKLVLSREGGKTSSGEDQTGSTWAAICAGGGAVYALTDEDGEVPAIWRFPLPHRFQLGGSADVARE